MRRKASAQWKGGLKDGKGVVSTASGALRDVPYTFSMRFEDAPWTNPEELVAAAHAGCFSMASERERVPSEAIGRRSGRTMKPSSGLRETSPAGLCCHR